MKLVDAHVGMRVRVESFERLDHAAEAIRLGLVPGSEITVIHKVGRGPVVVERGIDHIAIGALLSRRIVVAPID